jgi:hypothetical protein
MQSVWFTETLTVARAGATTDRLGKSVRDWANPESLVDTPGHLVIKGEADTPRDAVVVREAVAYLPTGTDVEHGDQIREVDDTAWEVTGVLPKKLPITNGSYVKVNLERVEHG